jgi:hypothetical protein
MAFQRAVLVRRGLEEKITIPLMGSFNRRHHKHCANEIGQFFGDCLAIAGRQRIHAFQFLRGFEQLLKGHALFEVQKWRLACAGPTFPWSFHKLLLSVCGVLVWFSSATVFLSEQPRETVTGKASFPAPLSWRAQPGRAQGIGNREAGGAQIRNGTERE